VVLSGFGEMLPRWENRVTLHPTRKDKWGIPIVHIDCSLGDNDRKVIAAGCEDAQKMIEAAGARVFYKAQQSEGPGLAIHEMGTAHMGVDPAKSVLNGYSQAHDISNLFVTDGACMASSGCQNPSLTYMAISARAAHYAAEFLREGRL